MITRNHSQPMARLNDYNCHCSKQRRLLYTITLMVCERINQCTLKYYRRQYKSSKNVVALYTLRKSIKHKHLKRYRRAGKKLTFNTNLCWNAFGASKNKSVEV